MAVKKGLGRGLSALLSDSEQEYDYSFREEEQEERALASADESPKEISISQIDANVNQRYR